MRIDRGRLFAGGLGALLAGLLAFGAVVADGNAAQQAVPAAERVVSENARTCQLDLNSLCTVTTNFGEVPKAINVQEYGAGQSATLVSKAADSYVLRWLWHDGTRFTTQPVVKFDVTYTFPVTASPPPTSPSPTATTPPPTPPATTPPATTPPATTPPATTPPATTPPTTGTGPAQTCTAGQTINEGAGASFFEPNGQEYFVHNNNWNDNYGGSHTIHACSYDKWYLTTSIPAHGDNAVEAYPNVHRDYNDVALSTIQSARFAAQAPACTSSLKYNVAFDIWIGSGFSNELMIWTENCNQRPAGNQVGTTVIGGKTYEVWKSGSGAGGIFTYVSTPRQLFGTMPLASFFADLNSRNWISGAQTTWQVDFGVETVTTGGTSQRFDFTDFFIND